MAGGERATATAYSIHLRHLTVLEFCSSHCKKVKISSGTVGTSKKCDNTPGISTFACEHVSNSFAGISFLDIFRGNPLIWGRRLTTGHALMHKHTDFYLHLSYYHSPGPRFGMTVHQMPWEKRHCHPQRFCLVTWCLSWLQIADLTHPAARFSTDTGGDQ